MMAMVSSGRYCGRKMLRQGCFTLRAYCATDKILLPHSIRMATTSRQPTTGSKAWMSRRQMTELAATAPFATRLGQGRWAMTSYEPGYMMWANLAGKLDVVELEAHVLRPSHLHAQPQNLPL